MARAVGIPGLGLVVSMASRDTYVAGGVGEK